MGGPPSSTSHRFESTEMFPLFHGRPSIELKYAVEKEACENDHPPSKPEFSNMARPTECAPKSATMCATLKPVARANMAVDCAQVKLASGRKPSSSQVGSSTRPKTKGKSSVPGLGGKPALELFAPGVEAK